MFTDVPLVRAARVGIGLRSEALAQPSTRAEFTAAGALLGEGESDREGLFVRSYARDTGEVMTILSVPLFVKGQRWGGAVIGWLDT